MKKNYLYNAAATLSVMSAMATEAHAGSGGGNGANEAMGQLTQATSSLPNFMMLGAYIMGIGLAITGLLKIKSSVENPGKEPIKDGLFRLVIGGGLLALGTVMKYMVDTASSQTDTVGLRTLATLTLK